MTALTVDTPLCNALESNALDSFDIRAWRSLAFRLERDLVLSALSERGSGIEREAYERAAKVAERFTCPTSCCCPDCERVRSVIREIKALADERRHET